MNPSGLSLCLHHRHHAIPADDIYLSRGPDALAALGANHLPCAAGPFPSWQHFTPALRGSPRPDVREGWQGAPAYPDLIPPF